VSVGINGTNTKPNIENIIKITRINQVKFNHSMYKPAINGMNHRRESKGINILYFSENFVSSLFLKYFAAISPKPVVQVAVPYNGQYVHNSPEKPTMYKTIDKIYKIKIIRPN
jgi:hypothetical protein